MSSMPRLRYAVVDSGPLIKGLRLETLNADVLVTVPEVLSELRDRATRQMLATLPVELTTREPSSEALDAIRKFSRLTGDLPALSAVDLRVLALAWMCEKEAKGGVGHLRTTPPPPGESRRGRRGVREVTGEWPDESEAGSEAGTASSEHGHQHQETEEEAEAALAAMAELAVGERRPLGEELLGASAGGEAEEEVEEVEEVFDDQPCAVLPNVYVGGVDAAANVAALKAKGITSILTVAGELPDAAAISSAAAQAATSGTAGAGAGATAGEIAGEDFARLHVPLSDDAGAPLLVHVPRCVAFIDGALADGGAVLIHCVAGRLRAPAIAAAFLMLRAKGEHANEDGLPLSAAEALERVQQARPWAEVHEGFVRQLEELDAYGRSASMSAAELDKCVAAALLPSSFIGSALATRTEYNASLALPDGERLALERAAKRKQKRAAEDATAAASGGRAVDGATGGGAAGDGAEDEWATVGGGEPDSYAAEVRAAKAAARKRVEEALAAQAASGGGLEEADDLPWVTVENLKTTQKADPNRRVMPLDAGTKVACLTNDFAMQSVLMQIGMKLMSSDGMLMRSVKQWVLRCSGCFTMQPSLEKQFCTKCGNTSLVRLISVLQADGSRRVLPEEGAPARVRSTNTRGVKFPMPKPIAGRKAVTTNLILSEDQLADAEEKMRRQGKARVRDVFDPDYSLDDHFGRTKKGGSGGGGQELKVGYGKRANPNDVRSRPKKL